MAKIIKKALKLGTFIAGILLFWCVLFGINNLFSTFENARNENRAERIKSPTITHKTIYWRSDFEDREEFQTRDVISSTKFKSSEESFDKIPEQPLILCGPDGSGVRGGEINTAVTDDFLVKDALLSWSGATLVRWSPEGLPIVPHIASKWITSADQKEWTFYLRKKMKWSDGALYTATDILYWWDNEVILLDKGVPQFMKNRGKTGKIVKIDDYTLKFIFEDSYPLFLEYLASSTLHCDMNTPAHYLQKYHPILGEKKLIKSEKELRSISTDLALYNSKKLFNNWEHPRIWPWHLTFKTTTAPYVFHRNLYYFAVDTKGIQLPYVESLKINVVDNSVLKINTGEGIYSFQVQHLGLKDMPYLLEKSKNKKFKINKWAPFQTSDWTIYPNLDIPYTVSNSPNYYKNKLINDREFRKALSIAIDRASLMEIFFPDSEKAQQVGPLNNLSEGRQEDFTFGTAYDPAQANLMLDRIGLTQRDSDGFRTFPNGSHMVWHLDLSSTYIDPSIAQFIIQFWKKIGVRATLRDLPFDRWNLEVLALNNDFNVYVTGDLQNNFIESCYVLPTDIRSLFSLKSGRYFSEGGPWNNCLNQADKPPINSKLASAQARLSEISLIQDVAQRNTAYNKLVETVSKELWTISITTRKFTPCVVDSTLMNVPRYCRGSHPMPPPSNAGADTYWFKN